MTTQDRMQKLKRSSKKGAKVAVILAIFVLLAGASLFQALALAAAIAMLFALPSGLIILSDHIAERPLEAVTESTGRRGQFMGAVAVPLAIISILYQFWFIARFTGDVQGERLGLSFGSMVEFVLLAIGFPGIVIPATIISLVRLAMSIPEILGRRACLGSSALFLFAVLMPIATYSSKPGSPQAMITKHSDTVSQAKPFSSQEQKAINEIADRMSAQEGGH